MQADYSGDLAAVAAAAALNWWNPVGWILTAVVVFEVAAIVTVVAVKIVEHVVDVVDKAIVDSKTKTAGGRQTSSVPAVSTPATPPNNNRNNRDDKQRNGTPQNNQAQNRQVDNIAKKLGLSKYQRAMLHKDISGQNLSYQEIMEIALEIKGMFSK